MRGHDLPLDYHRVLLDDFQRMDHYDRAIRALIRPGDVVLDLGAGTGILSMLCARRGARVHAVESMAVAERARELVAANGLADRVTVHRADAVTLAPVEPVDWVIGEFMGRFLVDDRMLDAVEAARAWLKPGGRFCPGRIRLRLAPVADIQTPWFDVARRPMLGLDLSPLVPHLEQGCLPVALSPGALFANPVDWHDWDLAGPPPPFEGSVRWVAPRSGVVMGLLGFFEATLAPGVVLSTAPGTTTHWGQVLFHLAPLPCAAGDVLEASLQLIPGEDLDFRWHLRQRRRGVEIASRSHQTGEGPGTTRAADRTERGGPVLEAAAAWEDAARALTPADDARAAAVYEALGKAYQRLGDPRGAIRAFLRALDGRPAGREQSARRIVECAGAAGIAPEQRQWLDAYEAGFGAHPTAGAPGSGRDREE